MVEVSLYVYDLSRGIARNMALALTGRHFDAIYHTSVVIFDTEYYFGNGIQQTTPPGSTHHGMPMEVIKMGETHIDQETFQEYLESLQTIYTSESYDILSKNCNNFSDDVCQFLVDKKIPSHITSLPSDFLSTPFGQMIAPQLGNMFRPITQAASVPPPVSKPLKIVQVIRNIPDLDRHIANSPHGCSILFFTSPTCPPCRAIQSTFESLASELGDSCAFLKISINQAQDCGRKYNVRATPTFITLLNGDMVDTWVGADPFTLKSNVKVLIEMSRPIHPHTRLELPLLKEFSTDPTLYSRYPPLDKVFQKIDTTLSSCPLEHQTAFKNVQSFLDSSQKSSGSLVSLPNLGQVSSALLYVVNTVKLLDLFPFVDALRLCLLNPRLCGYFAEHEHECKTISTILSTAQKDDCPFQLLLVTLQMSCNMFNSILAHHFLASPQTSELLISILTRGLLDDKENVRLAASSLSFNVCAFIAQVRRTSKQEVLNQSLQVEIVVALSESIQRETSPEILERLVTALFMLYYMGEQQSEVEQVCKALSVVDTLEGKLHINNISKKLKKILKEATLLVQA